jgi:hypothetical protein
MTSKIEIKEDTKVRSGRYQLGDISVELVDGQPVFHCSYLGLHPAQGGMGFGMDSAGMEDLDALFRYVNSKIQLSMPYIVEMIEKRENAMKSGDN